MKNAGDLLLGWISEIEHGSLRDLLDGIDWVARSYRISTRDGAAGRWVRDAVSLGFIDVDWVNGHWSVAPPVLTRLPASDGLLVLTGSRTAAATDRLNAASDAEIDVHSVASSSQEGDVPMPNTIMISDDVSLDHTDVARKLGASWVPCFALQVAEILPKLSYRGPAAKPLPGTPVDKYDFARSRFIEVPGVVGDGLYRFIRADHKRPYQILRDGTWRATTYEEGIYLELASGSYGKTSCIRWKREAESGRNDIGDLVVDWGTPLPALQRRAAVLCTGLKPRYSRIAGTAVYRNVPLSLAKAISRSLLQDLVLIS